VVGSTIAAATPAANPRQHAGTEEAYRLIEWLSFPTFEVHKGFKPVCFRQEGRRRTPSNTRAEPGDPLRLLERALGRRAFPDGRTVPRRRRLPVHRALIWSQHVNLDNRQVAT